LATLVANGVLWVRIYLPSTVLAKTIQLFRSQNRIQSCTFKNSSTFKTVNIYNRREKLAQKWLNVKQIATETKLVGNDCTCIRQHHTKNPRNPGHYDEIVDFV